MNRAEKALRIAELEGYHRFMSDIDPVNEYYQTMFANPVRKELLVERFSSFNGLMEIVFREKVFDIATDEGYIAIYENRCMIYSQEIKEPISALQDAIIFYHEQKEVKK